jgi:hypothetical protein
MTTPSTQVSAMVVLWPAFLMAGVMEMLVFALVDPASLRWFGGVPLELSPSAVYTAAFFVFWSVIAVAGLLVLLLERTPDDLNTAARRSAPNWPR